ncbi:XRE family transcriptional regulator [uncultured Rhodoferax sp.]|uniref:helix-turn-helix domain-containing protein n=1 Tax=uncultured Rhodoferax sp. TaxID=223188 RepID=UPI0025F20BB7|nr:XRE family transcriptional regulator [uncultured Rhodoferax sp.]
MAQAPSSTPLQDGPPAVGSKLQEIRKAQKLSLDELSKRAGVSKSMLSEVERNQANPTVGVLWRLASALGLSLSDLLAGGNADKASPTVELVPAHSIPVTTSPDGKCTLRILGPIALAGKVEWYELAVEPGGVLASEPHEAGAREHLSVLSGTLTVQAAESSKVLKPGDSARYAADVQHCIRNPGKGLAKAVLVVEHLG